MNSLLAGAIAAMLALGMAAEAAERAAPNAAAADQKVLGDIDDTINQLSNHLKLSPRRLRVSPPATRGAAAELPARVELVAGKSQAIDLPGEAREVVVGNTIVADVTVTSRRRIFLMARQPGQTNVAILDASGAILAQVDVVVEANAEAARAALARQFPDEGLDVASENGTLVLSGQVRSDALAGRAYATVRRFVEKDEQVVNLVKVSREQQVLIQVRVSEVQRNALKEIGVGLTNLGSTRIFGNNSLAGSTTARSLTSSASAGTFTFTGIADIVATLNLLETRGLVRSLAEPNLVAVSGETASMLAGGEYPVPVVNDNTVSIEYKPFGVTLAFLPVVLDSGRISLKLTTEVSSLSSSAVNLGTVSANSFTVRRASSTVELPNGGSLMIAGLIQNDTLTGMSGIPGFMDVPILGQLFRSDSFKRNETELVVVVNAHLVRPTPPAALIAPTDAVLPGGDLDRWLLGRLTGTYSSGFVREGEKADSQPLRLFGFTIDEVVR